MELWHIYVLVMIYSILFIPDEKIVITVKKENARNTCDYTAVFTSDPTHFQHWSDECSVVALGDTIDYHWWRRGIYKK